MTFKIHYFNFCCLLLIPGFVLVAIIVILFKRFTLFGDSPGCGNTFSNFSFICINFNLNFYLFNYLFQKLGVLGFWGFGVADNIAALYLGNMAAQVDKNEVIPRQVIELITTGKSAGVQAPAANKGAK